MIMRYCTAIGCIPIVPLPCITEPPRLATDVAPGGALRRASASADAGSGEHK